MNHESEANNMVYRSLEFGVQVDYMEFHPNNAKL